MHTKFLVSLFATLATLLFIDVSSLRDQIRVNNVALCVVGASLQIESTWQTDLPHKCLTIPRDYHASTYRLNGTMLLTNGYWSEAKSEFEGALRLDPTDRISMFYLALALKKSGKMDQSAKWIRSADASTWFYCQGVVKKINEEFDEAITDLALATMSEPGLVQSWIQLGNVNLLVDANEKAEDAYATAHDVLDRLDEEQFRIMIEQTQGCDKVYYRDLETTRLMADHGIAGALDGQAENLFASGSYDTAIERWQRALLFWPDQSWLAIRIGDANKAKGAFPIAEKYYLMASDLSPKEDMPHIYLGALYWEQGKKTEAFTEWNRSALLNPTNPLVHHWLAFGYKSVGNYSAAEKELRTQIALVSEKQSDKKMAVNVRVELIKLFILQQKFDEAYVELKIACNLNRENPKILNDLAIVLNDLGFIIPSGNNSVNLCK